ncbi:MAG: NAD(P)H-dependent oxidoreductase subunit E [Bacilli bacterium]|jgi:NADH:ubiquinone oxidoreductase subunit E|nr:NAD(P)H-dependent oxidoreductase subunit E [Bacilli bacterium]
MGVKLVLKDEQVAELMECMKKHKQKPGPLMPTLHDAQRIFGCVPLEVQRIISKELGETISKINGVVTFYSRFTIEPTGKHVINVCLGTACYVKGSQLILDEFSNQLHLQPGHTSDDGEFTLGATRCIGACGLAPVFTVDGNVYGQANPNMAKKALADLKAAK